MPFFYLYRYAARFDCGCEYRIKIKLLDGDRKVLACYEFKDNKGPGGDWFQVRPFIGQKLNVP